MVTTASPSSLICDVVDQAELVNVDRDFGVVDRLQRLDDRPPGGRSPAPAGGSRLSRRRGSRRDSRACARSSRRHARARRRRRPRRLPRSRSCVPRSSENPFHLLDARAPAPRCPLRSLCAAKLARAVAGTPSTLHQRLGAMVAGADRDARIVQYGGDVVRMHPVDVEADDPGAVLGAVQGHAADARAARRGIRATSAASCAWIASRPMSSTQSIAAWSPIAPTMCGVPASNRAGGSSIGRFGEGDAVDHRPAALPRRHRREQLGAAPQAADAGRAVELVAGESVEIAADRGDIDRHARHRLAAVEQQQRALGMGDLGGALARRGSSRARWRHGRRRRRDARSVSIASAASRSIWPSAVSGTTSTS